MNCDIGGNHMYAFVENFRRIALVLDYYWNNDINKLCIKNGDENVEINDAYVDNNTVHINLKKDIDIKKQTYLMHFNDCVKVNYSTLYETSDFNDRFYYDGDLGVFYSHEKTVFKVWSPAASSIALLLFKNGDSFIQEEPAKIKMQEERGLFTLEICGNFNGYFYQYEVSVYGNTFYVVDPYAKAVGINGLRGAIIDLKETSPSDWENDSIDSINSYTDAIIYETSIRDISSHPDSRVQNRGKYLGLTEDNTLSSKNQSTVLNHIIELGITHLQLMPFFDFSYTSVDERNPVNYNWGYDPQNYNVPEGSLATNPYEPCCRIYELKKMIQHLHKKGLHINMDVVYNHVCKVEESNFEKIFPGYYFRRYKDGTFSNGSCCGSDTASEHSMMRKFIIDSVIYWAKEYHLDGFRFDLMGIHDIETMNIIDEKLKSIGKNIMLYGEGWELNTSLPREVQAVQRNAFKTPNIGYFNDTIRDAVKGSVFQLKDKGFVNGKAEFVNDIKKSILGSVNYKDIFKGKFSTPKQSINYASCHDNSTLWDKFQESNPENSDEERKKMVKLTNAIILTSQGVPFLHSGEEFCRTKLGIQNSFNLPDNINCINWDRKAEYVDVFNYYKGLINLRKLHPAFRMNSLAQIEANIKFLEGTPPNTLGYIICNNANGDIWKNILIIYNANREPVSVQIPFESWYLSVDNEDAGVEPRRQIDSGNVEVAGISMCLLYNE